VFSEAEVQENTKSVDKPVNDVRLVIREVFLERVATKGENRIKPH
jgi:hypothetical protein